MSKIYKAILRRSRGSTPLKVTFDGDEAENAAHAYFTNEAEAFDSAEMISFESGNEDASNRLRVFDQYDISLDEIEELVESGGSEYGFDPERQYSN